MSVRQCACGCGQPIPAGYRNRHYATSACRTRDWKRREGYADYRRRKASRNAKSKPSGLQVSARKMIEGVEDLLIRQGIPAPLAALKANAVVYAQLSTRGRRRFDELQAKPKPPQTVGDRRAA